jgi:hypothetical protein
MANTLRSQRNGAVGFIDLLDAFVVIVTLAVFRERTRKHV